MAAQDQLASIDAPWLVEMMNAAATLHAQERILNMQQAEPDRIEYCLLSGEPVDPFSISYPYGYGISFGHCLALAQKCLSVRI
jgi:hypothetical protein